MAVLPVCSGAQEADFHVCSDAVTHCGCVKKANITGYV